MILDFVDVSELSLCTLPSLFGCPRDLDLRGEDASEAARQWEQIQLDYPELELEAGALTLREIQDRAAAFDPLTLEPNHEVRAISGNAWFSLGRHGVGLHFARAANVLAEVTVLARGRVGKRWEVTIDGHAIERFATLEEAVEAVDYEIDKRGPAARASARDDAPWRSAPPPAHAVARLRAKHATTQGEVLRLLVWEAVTRR
jgi:hypothetical protein